MSMILDALKRAEQDGAGETRAPSLQSPPIDSAKRGLSPLWAGLIALLGLLVVVMGYSLLSREDNEAMVVGGSGREISQQRPIAQLNANSKTDPKFQSSDTAPVVLSSEVNAIPGSSATFASVVGASITNEASLASATAGLADPSGEQNRVSDDGASAVADLYKQRDTEPAITGLHTLVGSTEKSVDSTDHSTQQPRVVAGNKRGGELAPESGGAPNSTLEESPVDLESVLRQAQAEWGEPALLPHPTALLESLSQQTKDRIPSVIYSVHDWQSAGRPTVVINGTRLATGQREGGFLVREILEDSVILSWGGTDFRLRALNSWINL